MQQTYVDTSALAKRYLPEATSAAFEGFVLETETLLITPLALTEFESALQRRLRRGEITADYLSRAREQFDADLHAAVWTMRPFPSEAFEAARRAMRELPLALATLDALHLASAAVLGCGAFATADVQLARAAQACGMQVHSFAAA